MRRWRSEKNNLRRSISYHTLTFVHIALWVNPIPLPFVGDNLVILQILIKNFNTKKNNKHVEWFITRPIKTSFILRFASCWYKIAQRIRVYDFPLEILSSESSLDGWEIVRNFWSRFYTFQPMLIYIRKVWVQKYFYEFFTALWKVWRKINTGMEIFYVHTVYFI